METRNMETKEVENGLNLFDKVTIPAIAVPEIMQRIKAVHTGVTLRDYINARIGRKTVSFIAKDQQLIIRACKNGQESNPFLRKVMSNDEVDIMLDMWADGKRVSGIEVEDGVVQCYHDVTDL